MSEENREAIERFVTEVRDPSTIVQVLLDLMDDDIVITDWMLPGVELRGRQEVIDKFFAPLDESFPGVQYVVDDVIAGEDAVVLRGDFVGRFSHDYTAHTKPTQTTIKAHGRDVRWTFHDIYRFEGGTITRIWYGNDTLLVGRQLGSFADDGVPW